MAELGGSRNPAAADLRSPLLPTFSAGNVGKCPAEAADVERLGIDEILQQHAGEFGRWQFRHFVMTSAAWALEAFHTMIMIFADHEPPWRCLDGGRPCPPDQCGLARDQWEWIEPGVTTVAKWGLICGQKYKVGLVQALFFAGCMIGAGVFGHLSDSSLGRKGSLMAVCSLNAIFGVVTALSPNYWFYAVLRFLTGFSTGGVGLCAFVLATEPVGPSKRGVAGMSTFYFFSGGIAILSGMAYLFTSWGELYIIMSIPSFIFLVFVLPRVSESPRWYLVRRDLDRAMEVMRGIAKVNGKEIPSRITLKLDNEDEDKNSAAADGAVSGSIVDVLRSPVTRVRLFLTVVINFLCSIVYYGLSLNVVNLETNLYLSVLLNAVAEMPAFLLTAVLIDQFGRKPLSVGTMWLSGIFCVVGSLVGGGAAAMKIVRMVCGLVGIFGMAATYNLLFIYTAELFPTVVRNAALGCATQASQMGAIAAPFVVALGGGRPFAVFGVAGLVGGLLAFYLPETMNRPLYDTLAGLEEGEGKPEE